MAQPRQLTESAHTSGDAAVDGLLQGVLAGVAMAVYLIAAGLFLGEGWRQCSSSSL
jgi:hypothetical protein